MTKTLEIHAVSDLHGNMPSLPGGDILIIAGDCTAKDTEREWNDFFGWINNLDYKKIFYIGGNHDNQLQKWDQELDKLGYKGRVSDPEDKIEYLCDSGSEYQSLKFHGSPWQPSFIGQNPICAAFSLDTEEELAKKFKLIPDDVDILITHGPPMGILDKCHRQRVGSKALLDKVTTIRPMLHIFGHIHDCGMQSINDFDEYENKDSHFLNCAFVDEDYEPRNQFFRICLESVNNKWEVKMISRRKV